MVEEKSGQLGRETIIVMVGKGKNNDSVAVSEIYNTWTNDGD